VNQACWAGRMFCGLLVLAVLGGCAVREQRPSGAWLEEREQLFAELDQWSVSGRIALSDGQRGGSLAFEWQADGDRHEIHLRTVAGGRQWRLRFEPGSAFLEGSNADELWGHDPDPLVEAAVGWPIPVTELAWWIRGLIPPDKGREVRFAEDGTLSLAITEPWVIDFQRFSPAGSVLMPVRIQAESNSYRVRMVLRNWNLEANGLTKSL
jgi:outer membrane lipoprotein LolB